MKTIGLIGGMSWESTLLYYRYFNELTKIQLGEKHSAKCLIYSVDFEEISKLQHENKWSELLSIMIDAGARLEEAGADLLLLGTNTMHKLAPEIERTLQLPFLHIADAVGEELMKKGVKTTGLLGTSFTMEGSFYKERLIEKFGIQTVVPSETDRRYIHNVIYDELVLGKINNESRQNFQTILHGLEKKGAEAVILGCTEIPLLIKDEDASISLLDSTYLHAAAAVNWSA